MQTQKMALKPKTGHNASPKAPIFVVGAPRSGTTLIAKILGNHRDVFRPGETHYFEDIWARRKGMGKLDIAELSHALDRLLTAFDRYGSPGTQDLVRAVISKELLIDRVYSLGGSYGAIYYAFMSMLAESVGKTRFCDDTPRHLFYLHTIFDFYPEARVVGCIRDPRDFLCSYKHVWKVGPPTERAQFKALYHPVFTSLLWRSSANLLLKHSRQCCNGRIILVRYETLVEQPQEEVRRVCDFLGLDYTDVLTQVEPPNSSFEQSSSGIYSASIGRWYECLSQEETWWVQTLAGSAMHKCGYEAEATSLPKRALFVTSVTTPLAFVKYLRIHSNKRGSLIGFVMRRLMALLEQ
jgi:hypothetical protein